jgi:hypothetical protein
MSASGDYLTDQWGNPISEGEPAPVVAAPGSPSVFSVDYYRNKVTEFQNVLLEMDAAAAIALTFRHSKARRGNSAPLPRR